MGGFGYRGWGGMGGGMATTATQTNIPIGTLIVDLVDPKTNEMVWRGTAQDQVSGNGADRGKDQQAMQKLFTNFPPAAGQQIGATTFEIPGRPGSPAAVFCASPARFERTSTRKSFGALRHRVSSVALGVRRAGAAPSSSSSRACTA